MEYAVQSRRYTGDRGCKFLNVKPFFSIINRREETLI